MSNAVKVALIISATILSAVGMWIYFTPYQTCVRSYGSQNIGATECYRPKQNAK